MEPESPAQTEIIEEKPVRAGRSKAMRWTFVGVGTSLVLVAALFLFIGPLVKPTISGKLGSTVTGGFTLPSSETNTLSSA